MTGLLLVAICLTVGVLGVDEEPVHKFNHFDWGLTKILDDTYTGNTVVSPLSVKVALATLFEGARGNTAKQLEKALRFREVGQTLQTARFAALVRSLETPGEAYDLDIGTKVFIDSSSEPRSQYNNKIKYLYSASVDKVNFQKSSEAANYINSWVSLATHGHIKDLLSENDDLSRVKAMLINAIYFKGRWENPFPPQSTASQPFYLTSSKVVNTPFMKTVSTVKYYDSPEIKAKLIRLPYHGDKFSMILILPHNKDGLKETIMAIDPDKLRHIISEMRDYSTQVQLPKFKYDFTASLQGALEKMGVTEMFTSKANLTGMVEDDKSDLFVSNILQKAGIEVNEVGTTAFAATEIDLVSKFGEETAEFIADHPFLFLIEDDPTGSIIFMGKVIDPTLGSSGKGSQSETSQRPASNNPVSAQENYGPQPQPTSDTDNRFGNQEDPGPDPFNFFDTELLQKIYADGDQNVVVSPASIKTVLGLVLEGADGRTARQIMDLLRLPRNKTIAQARMYEVFENLQNTKADVTLKAANRILTARDLNVKPGFKQSVSENYKTQVSSFNFANPQNAVNEVNDWVSKITQGFIPKLLDEDALDPATRVVLLNAMYFKGEWLTKFDPKDTQMACFYPQPSECIKTPMMTLSGFFKYEFIRSLNAKIIELPYKDDRYSMVILLPAEKNRLRQLVRDLPFRPLLPIIRNLDVADVILKIPKFIIDYDIKLAPVLERMGLTEIFTDRADLSAMLARGKGKVSKIFHKAKIEVSEKGTTAGAGTASVVVPLMSPQGAEFIADHPFLFFIRDKVTGILFEGAFVRPTASSSSGDGVPLSLPTRPQDEIMEGPARNPYEPPRQGGGGAVQSMSYPPRAPPPYARPNKNEDGLQFT